jgi:hypothetical protein
MKHVSFITVLTLIITGCSSTSSRNSPDESLKGTLTPEGHLIFFEWTTSELGTRDHYAALRDDYGMMIFYNVFTDNPVPRFELYCYEDKSIYKTQSIDEFKEALSRIPSGKRLHYYNTCAGGTHHALDPNVLNSIKTFCQNNNVVFHEGDDELRIICTCS